MLTIIVITAVRLGPSLGLTLIAFGTGGIKPCVSAFGGDQFKESQTKERSMFFSAFYFAINLGSFLSMVLTPLIKDGVTCFNKKCYSLAFGIPALLMVIAVGLFVWGKKWYTIRPPAGSVITNVVKCIGNRIKFKMSGQKTSKEHWLDYAGPEYHNSFLADVKQILKIFLLFIPVPVFWALFDQMGSRWTLQSVQLDRRMTDNWFLLPEQIQAINCVLILFFIPLFELGFYPCMDKLKVPNKPLQRLVVGMLFASLAFVAAGLLQITIDNTQMNIEANNSRISFINQVPCPIKVTGSLPQLDLDQDSMSSQLSIPASKYQFLASRPTETSCPSVDFSQTSLTLSLRHELSYYVVYSVTANVNATGVDEVAVSYVNEKHALYFYKVFIYTHTRTHVNTHSHTHIHTCRHLNTHSHTYIHVHTCRYRIILQEDNKDEYQLETFFISNGGKYTVLINKQLSKTSTLLEDLPHNVVSIWLQFPQYILITLAEVVFAVTGLSFAYSQAPSSMKSVVQAAWLLTTAFGNVIDVIVTGSNLIPIQYVEFFFFAILMFVTTIIFAIMTSFYKYVDHQQPPSPPPYENLSSDTQNNNLTPKNYGPGAEIMDENDKKMLAVREQLHSEDKIYEGVDAPFDGGPKKHDDVDKGYIAEMSLNR
ncbi:hypothetical protein HELRODRAFT_111363 [Helobdella robusta]|uniref:Uncharacterized protein n=1 Tax=Helobdella robusta TaxID=6412 RepID=T1EFA6_HELRO|nr:hypothetical protein HELRODRAFT_111363 [Helobdella robusta]ESO04892.1 hypothetical protein HELRODRAFT_111363 [Helobdella robusta]